MANRNRVLGQVTIEIDGERMPTSGESTLQIGGPQREGVPGDYDAGSFMERTVNSRCVVSLLHKDGLSVAAMRAIDNATLIFKGDNGKTWLIRGAYFAEAGDIGQDGKVSVTFDGQPAEELL